MFNSGTKRIICLLMVLAIAPVALTGCIGSFAAWNKVKDFNEEASESKWVQELLFLVLHIIPVYGIAYFIDILIINSIEFWTGENPMMSSRTIVGEDGAVTTMTPIDDTTLEVTIVTPDGEERSFQLERGDETVTARDADGNVMASAKMNGAKPELVTE